MAGVQKIERATLRVTDVRRATDFYTKVMGLVEHHSDETSASLGCGLDDTVDLIVREGGTGVEQFSVRTTEAAFQTARDRLEESGVPVERRTGDGFDDAIYVSLPSSGIDVGLVLANDRRYHHVADATHFLDSTAPVSRSRRSIAPLDLDHIGIIAPDVERDVAFLSDQLGFLVSDVKTNDDDWQQAFVRSGAHYHDIAIFARDPRYSLHHLAWQMDDVNAMKLFADRLAQHDHQLELGFVRHGPGATISIYFQEPGGNRFEYSTEQPTVDPDAPTGFYDGTTRHEGVSLWGGSTKPDTFDVGS